MAHAEYTGKSAGTTVSFDSSNVPTGWTDITIDEKGAPAASQIDSTHAGDASWQFIDDPLGGEGAPNCTVTIAGNFSITDHQDTGLIAKALDAIATLLVTVGTGCDLFTLASAQYKSMNVGAGFAEIQPFSATFTNDNASGVWSTQGA